MTQNNSIDLSKSLIANRPVNTNITSMAAITTTIKAPTSFNDTNNNIVLELTSISTSSEYFNVSNSAAASFPNISPLAAIANKSIFLRGKAAGGVIFKSPSSTTPATIWPFQATLTNKVNLTVPVITANRTHMFMDTPGFFNVNAVTDNITAFATGGQANATLIVTTVNRVVTVANANDSIKLPAVTNGQYMVFYIRNDGANSLNLFPNTSSRINSLGLNAAFAMAAGARVIVFCGSSSQWFTASVS